VHSQNKGPRMRTVTKSIYHILGMFPLFWEYRLFLLGPYGNILKMWAQTWLPPSPSPLVRTFPKCEARLGLLDSPRPLMRTFSKCEARLGLLASPRALMRTFSKWEARLSYRLLLHPSQEHSQNVRLDLATTFS
jgi:hypothetical protein